MRKVIWLAFTRMGTGALVLMLAWMAYEKFGPRKPEISSDRKEMARELMPRVAADLATAQTGVQSVALLHFENDPSDFVTDALRKELEESGAFLDVRDHTFGAKLRDFLNLRHPSYGEAGPAVEAVTSRNVQAVVYGTIHRFESTENATELDLEISLAAVPSGELLFTRRYDEQQGSGLLPGAETPESIRRIGFAKRFFLLALLILLLPVFTIVFIRTMVRKRENRSNALTLGVYTAADAILALLLLGTDFRSFLSVLFLLVIITAALLYNVAIMTHAVRLEAE